MKRIISVFCVLALVGSVAFAQNKPEQKKGNDWREKVRAEQVAFITSELDLTESEAQSFWPVYNEVQKQRRDAFRASGEAFKNLKEGLDGKDVSALLNKYLEAKKACDKVEEEAVARFKKVLPVEKVAKLLLAEENFRHQQIGRLQRGTGNGGPQGAPQRPNRGQRPSQNQENAPSTK